MGGEEEKAQGSICKEKDLFVKILTGGRTGMQNHENPGSLAKHP
jgi:hypothetical protein